MRRAAPSLGLLALILLGVAWLGSRDPDSRLSTEVTALLPVDERDPGAQLVRSLATTAHTRTQLVVVEGLASRSARQDAARIVTEVMTESPLVAEVWSVDVPQLPPATRQQWVAHAVPWFWPQWWESHGRPATAEEIARRAVRELDAFLERPESFAWEDAVTEDPFLLVPRSLERLGGALPLGAGEDQGVRDASPAARVWLRLAVSPFSREGQSPVFSLLDEAERRIRDVHPEAVLRHAGTNRFAAASEAAIRAEVTRLNLCVALTVTALCLLFLRRWTLIPPLMLIVGVTVLAGGLSALAVFVRVHVLTLVIGSILIGVAIDYGLHVLLEADGGAPRARLRKVARPLLVGSLSTIGGFLVLLLTELPVLRQLGVFIAGGLGAALLVSLLYAASPPVAGPAVRWLGRLGALPSARPILLGGLLLSPLLLGLFRIEWQDDIRELDYPLPQLRTEDQQVRDRFGDDEDHRYLLLANNWADLEAAAGRLSATAETPVTSLAHWVTGADLAAEAHALAGELDLVPHLRTELEAAGYAAEAFAPFFEQWAEWVEGKWTPARYEATVSQQLASLPGPAALLSGAADGRHWWLVRAAAPLAPPEEATLVPVRQLDSLNAVFARYRSQATLAAGIGLGVLALGLVVGFGPRTGGAVLLLPVLPALLVLGFFGWQGQPLNLFHLLGSFLGVCLTVDYIVFALHARRQCAPLPVSILLSALTTAGSFGWLATSAIPAVAALGGTVAPAVLLAAALALGLTAQKRLADIPPHCVDPSS